MKRLRPLLGGDGLKKLQKAVVSIAGLGGTGSPAFVQLLRMGVSRFRIAEHGVFNEPDINRQAGAFHSTMNMPKIDVYWRIARDINPRVELELFREGLTLENMDAFVQGSDVFVRMFNHEKVLTLESAIPIALKKHGIPCFSSYLLGFGTLVYNYKPDGLSIAQALSIVSERSPTGFIGGLLPPWIVGFFSPSVMKRVGAYVEATGEFPSNALAAELAGTLLVSEVCVYLLQETGIVERDAIWAPKFITFDLFTLEFQIRDVSKIAVCT